MSQRSREIDALISKMRRGIRAEPAAGVVIGTLHIHDGTVDIAVGAEGFSPMHWVALGDAALEWAHKRLAALPGDNRDHLMMIERARTALDFEEYTRQ